ncbi:MAG: hypothetical protein AB7K24_34510, partial [Gemmataceae bacterium]
MLGLSLYLLLIWVILLGVFWGGGLWLQAYLYSAPDEQLQWRAPVTATILVAFYGGWCFLAVQHPGRHDTLFRFNSADEIQFKRFWSIQDQQKVEYRERLVTQGDTMPVRSEFVEARPPYRPWQRTDSIIVEEDGKEVRFAATRDANGKFKPNTSGVLIYRDERGRAMSEDAPGLVSTYRWDVLLVNLVMNLLHLALWFG